MQPNPGSSLRGQRGRPARSRGLTGSGQAGDGGHDDDDEMTEEEEALGPDGQLSAAQLAKRLLRSRQQAAATQLQQQQQPTPQQQAQMPLPAQQQWAINQWAQGLAASEQANTNQAVSLLPFAQDTRGLVTQECHVFYL